MCQSIFFGCIILLQVTTQHLSESHLGQKKMSEELRVGAIFPIYFAHAGMWHMVLWNLILLLK